MGTWTRSGHALRTPLVLSAGRDATTAPAYAEGLLVSDRTEDGRFQVRISGSVFAPRVAEHPDDLPPTKGLPLSVADLEFPEEGGQGDLAVVASEGDLAQAATADAIFLANGPEFERSPRDFLRLIGRLREILGPAKVIAVTGLATPSNVSVLVYAGIDLVDSSRMVLDGARGMFHTSDGCAPISTVDRNACGCPACSAGESVQAHNEYALHREVLLVRNHLSHSRLRELVERRLANAPWNTAVVRHLDLRGYDLVEPYAPVAGGEMLAYAHESLHRPEIVRFRRRVRERYEKPPHAKILLLLPCSARKPYSASRSHRRFRQAIAASRNPSAVHEVIVTSPLGLVPRELESFYPARAYDIPVTGDWSRDEASIVSEDLAAYVEANRYDAIVAHLGAEAQIVHAALPDAISSTKDHPSSDDSLVALTRALDQVAGSTKPVTKGVRFTEEMTNIARFQFGEPGRQLLERATFRGRFPDVRVFREGHQVAMHTGRGLLSLTLDGGEI
ncbi:MAG TPA: DUF5591 domain-containing protein, partial [Thermoplasmata archaeon]|nr:DUF5591 domain-containing protein [Thermoplasmata archaeon]